MANDYKEGTIHRLKNWEFSDGMPSTNIWLSRWLKQEGKTEQWDLCLWGEILGAMYEVLEESIVEIA